MRNDVQTDELVHREDTRCSVPTPASERDLPTAVATPYFKVADHALPIEGPAFDRQGRLLFVDIYGSRVLRLTPERQLSTVYAEPGLNPAGIAVHKDGRLFIAAVGPTGPDGQFLAGSVVAIDADGGGREVIVPASAGYVVDDLVFDSDGGFYFTDFRGSSTEPAGGVYYVPPDFKSIVPVIPRMCGANGVALSPDGKVLWATEHMNSRLHRVDLRAPGLVARVGASIPYHFVGRAPDSMRCDSAGNVYVAMQRQGRVLVFSPLGIPIGQILMPGRERDRFLKCTSLAIAPGSRDLFVVSWNETGDDPCSMVFSARGFAPGLALYSHR
jgi:lactonase